MFGTPRASCLLLFYSCPFKGYSLLLQNHILHSHALYITVSNVVDINHCSFDRGNEFKGTVGIRDISWFASTHSGGHCYLHCLQVGLHLEKKCQQIICKLLFLNVLVFTIIIPYTLCQLFQYSSENIFLTFCSSHNHILQVSDL